VAQELNLGRLGLAVFEVHSATPGLQIFGPHDTLDFDHIGLGDRATRMQKDIRELTIVGREQDPTRVEVEPADGEHPHMHPREKLSHARPAFRIVHGRDHTAWLVKSDVRRLLPDDPCPVDLDATIPCLNFRSHLRDDASVHTDATGRDELFGRPPGRHTGSREDLLQSNRGHAPSVIA